MDAVFPGDLSPGDLIALPGGNGELVVLSVRLGGGGCLITVSGPSVPGSEREVVLTTWVPVLRRRVSSLQAWPELLPPIGSDMQHEQAVPARRHTASS